MTQPRRIPPAELRARYARTTGSLRINQPDGLPSGIDPIVWWWGSDLTPNAASGSTSLSAITRATALIVNSLTSLPWLTRSGDPTPQGLSTVQDTRRWLSDPMLLRPDARTGLPSPQAAALRQSRVVFWSQWIRSALWWGMGYLVFQEDATGQPIAGTMRVLNPRTVSPLYNDPDLGVRRRIGSQIGGGGYVDTDIDGSFMLGSSRFRLLELRNPTTDTDEYGVAAGVLTAHAAELSLAQAAVTYGRGTLRSGVPHGYLKVSTPSFTGAQAQALKEGWLNAHGGDSRSIAVLNSTTDFQPLALSPVDMALIEMRRMSLLDIANAFGVPAYMIGGTDGGSNTYSNAESRNRDFLTFSLMPWATTVEDVLSSLLPAGTWVEVDFTGLLRPDTATRYAANAQAVGGPWKTVDEVRAEEDLPPMPAQATQEVPAP